MAKLPFFAAFRTPVPLPIRLFLVDDHPLVRSGLRALLAPKPGIAVVGEARHGQALLEQLLTTPADVVLLDLHMPVLDGLATTQRLRAVFPAVKVVVLSMLGHVHHASQLLGAGASGYVLKSDEPPEIALAIRTASAGRQYLCSELSVRRLHHVLDAATPSPVSNSYNFSPCEF